MINKIANCIADFVCDKKMHEKNDYERAILVYGYEIILSSALSFAAVIVLGLAFCTLLEAIIFFLTFYFISCSGCDFVQDFFRMGSNI